MCVGNPNRPDVTDDIGSKVKFTIDYKSWLQINCF